VIQGFILGLANGVTCTLSCAPVLLPFLVGEGYGWRRNALAIARFLFGRLAGYLLFGVLAWAGGSLVTGHPAVQGLGFGLATVILAAMLMVYGFRPPRAPCAAGGPVAQRLEKWVHPALLPILFGFLTGVNLCAPFLLALTQAIATGTLIGSVLFFLAFFAGTSVYMVPLGFSSLLWRWPAVQIVGRLAAGVVGAFYLYKGVILCVGGWNAL
jgi:sulfite exporter TauE/SafE